MIRKETEGTTKNETEAMTRETDEAKAKNVEEVMKMEREQPAFRALLRR